MEVHCSAPAASNRLLGDDWHIAQLHSYGLVVGVDFFDFDLLQNGLGQRQEHLG